MIRQWWVRLTFVGLIAVLITTAAASGWAGQAWDRVTSAYERRFRTGRATAFLMGTYVVVTAEGRGAQAAVERALARLEEVDRRLDAFDPSSEIALLAARAGGEPIPVSPDTLAFLELSDRIHHLSGGAFDPTVGPLVELWGFGAGPSRTAPPAPSEVDAALGAVGWVRVSWDRALGHAGLTGPGMSLVTGALAKGYAVDQAAAELLSAGIERAVIDAGGDLYLLGRRDDGGPWRVAVSHPRSPSYLGLVLVPPNTAIATSGDYERYFEHQGVRYHHLLDPRTGYPASGCLGVTVVAPTAAEADALATAIFVLGPERGRALAEDLPGVEALIYTADGQLVMTGGMAAMLVPAGEGGEPDGGD